MKEIVVISGKGGTGKTSIVAAFAALAGQKVLADCDVDAADLHLVLNPKVDHRKDFSGSKKATIREDECIACEIGRA
ncbi:MAG: (4Fe-4S)-binding protein, partial [Syntrophales bacterium]|nr:(4Fe-4S)-binding protein [Syntrophales bacterium]